MKMVLLLATWQPALLPPLVETVLAEELEMTL